MATEHPKEIWTYMGARAVRNPAERRVTWLDPTGTTLYFKDRGNRIIGGQYEVQVERPADGGLTMYGTPHWTGGDHEDKDRVRGWRAAEAAAEAEIARGQIERRRKGEESLEDLLEPLIEVARTLRTGPERDALAALIIRRVSRGAGW